VDAGSKGKTLILIFWSVLKFELIFLRKETIIKYGIKTATRLSYMLK
jgi:hypothetical protein